MGMILPSHWAGSVVNTTGGAYPEDEEKTIGSGR